MFEDLEQPMREYLSKGVRNKPTFSEDVVLKKYGKHTLELIKNIFELYAKNINDYVISFGSDDEQFKQLYDMADYDFRKEYPEASKEIVDIMFWMLSWMKFMD